MPGPTKRRDLVQETHSHPQWFECLCRRAAASNENEAKWQFAAYLPECSCSQKVRDIILDFAKDPNEYVSRRALLAMPALRPDCVEQFAPLFWERNCYSPELQEYQRIAVLISLDAIHSDQLPQYLEWAKQDGQSYLLEHAKRIEGGLSMNEKLSRPQFNQMDTTEKQALMESLAARYTMTFLGLHTFDHWGQSCTTGIFEKDGREFVFVPGDTVTLGWEQFAEGLNQESREELDYLFQEWEMEPQNPEEMIRESMAPVRQAVIGPMLVAGNKCDLASDEQVARFEAYVKEKGYSFFPIMAAIHYGVDPLVKKITEELSKLPPIVTYEPEPAPQEEFEKGGRPFTIRHQDGVWFVEGEWLLKVMSG